MVLSFRPDSNILNILKEAKDITNKPIELKTDDLILKDKLEGSLYEFIKYFWRVVEGDTPFKDNWHIKAIAEHLEAAREGLINLLSINIPFRCMKSLICCVFFPAHTWTIAPHAKFFNLSGGFALSKRDTLTTRRLITSPEYQKFWGNKVRLRVDVNTAKRYENTAGGYRMIASMKSSAIGFGGNFLIVDDANVSQDIYSDTTRENANNYITSSFGVRRDDPTGKMSCLINIQQRLHSSDLTGFLLERGHKNMVHLMLPMEFESERKCTTIPLLNMKEAWSDPRTKEGELLWPERFPASYIEDLKITLGPYNSASQLQQRPAPVGGGVFKGEWFKGWKEPRLPDLKYVIQSWDTALSDNEEACDSAMTTWGVFEDDFGNGGVMLINAWSGKLLHPELRHFMKRCYYNCFLSDPRAPEKLGREVDLMIIEEAANGKALIDDLRRANLQKIQPFKPKHHGLKNATGANATSKIGRAHLGSTLIYQGKVWLPYMPNNPEKLAPFAQKLLDSALLFPRGGNKDLIDSMSQALIVIMQQNLVYYVGEVPEPIIDHWAHEKM